MPMGKVLTHYLRERTSKRHTPSPRNFVFPSLKRQTSEFAAGLQRLIRLAWQKRTALMCAEAVPWRCHRSRSADALAVLGIRVEHIMSKNRSQLHSLTSFARVRRSCITYPGYKDDHLLSSNVRTVSKE